MIKRTITTAQRFGIWKAGKGRCFWCREPVLFRDVHVDHVIPLDAINKVGASNDIRRRYELPADFDFDGFENWVPSHAGCNQRKSFTLPDPAPEFTMHLAQVRVRASLAKKTAESIERDSKKAALLAKINSALVAGDITGDDIEQFFSGLLPVVKKDLKRISFLERLKIAPGWEVQITGDRVSVKRLNA